MNFNKLYEAEHKAYNHPVLACGGSRGPSAAEIQAQAEANARLAEAETARIKAESDAKQQEADAKALAESVSAANTDAARRARNRTLLAGVLADEGLENGLDDSEAYTDSEDLEDPDSPSQKKAKRATLLAGV